MIIGIDPGKNGAIVALWKNTFYIYDIPTIKTTGLKNGQRAIIKDYDRCKINQICHEIRSIAEYDGKPEGVWLVIEDVKDQIFNTGNRHNYHNNQKTVYEKIRGFIILETIFEMNGFKVSYTPRANDWKRTMKLCDSRLSYSEKKEKSRLLAISLHPELAPFLTRKKDADRAEAVLLIDWAIETKGAK